MPVWDKKYIINTGKLYILPFAGAGKGTQKMKLFIKNLSFALLGAALVCAALGVLLVFFQPLVSRLIPAILGASLAVYGIVEIISYFRTDSRSMRDGFRLGMGVLLIIVGGWMFTDPEELTSLVVIFLAVVLLFHGSIDLAYALRQKQLGYRGWYLTLLAAILSCGAGIVMLVDPFGTRSLLFAVLGWALIFEAAVNIYIAVLMAVLERRVMLSVEAIETDASLIPDDQQEL